MKIYQIQLLEPNAERLLEELVRLKLISFQELPSPRQLFLQLLEEFREKEGEILDLQDITKEVETVRANRYSK